jgi:hypothetical protein
MSNVPLLAPDPAEPVSDGAGQNTGSESSPALILPNFLPPAKVVSLLSEVRTTQPVAALAAVNQHQAELTEVFLQAVERAIGDPINDFSKHGMLFNYASYFLAKWREPRAFPLFLRWFSLPGEDALELGGDTLTLHGARLLAAVSGGKVEPIKELVTRREANPVCRAVALTSLGVLLAWNQWPRVDADPYLLWLAKVGLERTPGACWNALTGICVHLEVLPVFVELRRARDEKLIPESMLELEDLNKVEQSPRGQLTTLFAQKHPPITDVIQETRWWAGFQQTPSRVGAEQGGTYVAPEKVGRNDPCPCGSGKKFKKCCGA